MGYQLAWVEKEPEAGASDLKIGEARGVTRVFFNDLPEDYKVFLLYFRAAMGNKALENALVELGDNTGKNLLVNLGSAADPSYEMITNTFDIERFPSIIMTAVPDLASVGGYTTFAKMESRELLSSPERTVECAEKMFNLFLRGDVAKAISSAKWTERGELAKAVLGVMGSGLKAVGNFVASRDISVSVLEGKFDLKRSGG